MHLRAGRRVRVSLRQRSRLPLPRRVHVQGSRRRDDGHEGDGMQRGLILGALLVAGRASAEPPVAPSDISDQNIGAELGLAAGGRVTPGGLRIAGHYLYQLNDVDWFDGSIGFTYGG